jgi:hypothetical protein
MKDKSGYLSSILRSLGHNLRTDRNKRYFSGASPNDRYTEPLTSLR